MRKIYLLLLFIGGAYYAVEQLQVVPSPERAPTPAQPAGESVYGPAHSGRQVRGEGAVTRLLADDNDGSRHQRFILRLPSGQTLLIAHNIDLAPRVPSLEVGDAVSFYGEYEWNEQGGVIHWTHHDPQRRHPGGWLEHEGRRYE